MDKTEAQSYAQILEYVSMCRVRNKLKREIADNDNKIRDNQKRVLLLDNLNQYISDDMTIAEIRVIINNMRNDYEDRIDDYVIRNAELSKQRRELAKNIRTKYTHK